jgi:hypothetical protein
VSQYDDRARTCGNATRERYHAAGAEFPKPLTWCQTPGCVATRGSQHDCPLRSRMALPASTPIDDPTRPTLWERWRSRKLFKWKPVPQRRADAVEDWSQPLLMRRFHLFACRWFECGFHLLLQPDNMVLGHHDHPWHFWSIVLWGGYLESYFPDWINAAMPGARAYLRHRTRLAGSMGFHPAHYTHAICEVAGGKPCLTFFVSFRRSRVWGFPERGIEVD